MASRHEDERRIHHIHTWSYTFRVEEMIAVLIAVTVGATALLTPVRANDLSKYPSCVCGPQISYTITVKNEINVDDRTPIFSETYPITISGSNLMQGLVVAAQNKEEFKFEASFDNDGWRLTALKGLTAPEGFFWQVTNSVHAMIDKGLTDYVPTIDDVITISLQPSPKTSA